jgi:hypothetical protein
MFSHHKPLTKEEKKKLQLKKNKFNQEFFNFVRLRRREEARVKGLEKAISKPKSKEKDADKQIWSAKVLTIRDRLTNKRRVSEDRWNRFAGTSDGGGRGR